MYSLNLSDRASWYATMRVVLAPSRPDAWYGPTRPNDVGCFLPLGEIALVFSGSFLFEVKAAPQALHDCLVWFGAPG